MTTSVVDPAVGEPELLERSPKSLVWLWANTLKQARKTVEVDSSWLHRTRVRLQALASIRQPIFVIGCPRSGTTYLGSLLAELPGATYFFEPPLFKYYVRRIVQRSVSDRHASAVYRWGLRALLLAAPGSGRRIVEKNPNHVFAVEHLLRVFPDAKLVFITRDGRDVAVSLSEKPWHRSDSAGSGLREPAGYLYGPYPHFYIEPERTDEYRATSDLHRAIWIWRQHQLEVERIRKVVPRSSQFHLRYEDLVQTPESVLPELLRFLDCDADHAGSVLDKASEGRSTSVGRWVNVVGNTERQMIQAEAGDLLTGLGYVQDVS